jgi:hypothetical protein
MVTHRKITAVKYSIVLFGGLLGTVKFIEVDKIMETLRN